MPSDVKRKSPHSVTEADLRKRRVWHHNSFRGFTSMGQRNMYTIRFSDSATPEAKQLAAEIGEKLHQLSEALKTRVDPE